MSEIGVSVCVFGEKPSKIHQKNAKFARFLNSSDVFDSDLFYSTAMALQLKKLLDCSSFLRTTSHFSSFYSYFRDPGKDENDEK